MTDHQWVAIERALTGLSMDEKLEVADRILQLIRTESDVSDDRTRRQRDALNRLCRTVDAMPPTGPKPDDDLTNRDHDRLIYTQ